MLSQRQLAPSPTVSTIVAGHFTEGPDYEAWRPHGTRDWLLIFTTAGSGRFTAGHITFLSVRGDLTLLAPGTQHDYGTNSLVGQWELFWAHFHPRPHWLEIMDWPEIAPGLMRLSPRGPAAVEEVRLCFEEANRRAASAIRRGDAFAMNALERILLRCDACNPLTARERVDHRVQIAMEYICFNLALPLTSEMIADASGLSVSRLAHLFQKQASTTIQQYLEAQRLHRAQQLLELTSRTIQSIASEVGFQDPFYFSQRFKRHTGLSPRSYRRKTETNG